MEYSKEYFKNNIWRFVIRQFARIYIHEEGFFYSGEEKENGKIILWEVNHVTDLVKDGKENLIMGLPKPKHAGYTYDGGHKIVQNIYCDSLFLCPDCGCFYFHDEDQFTFSRYLGKNLDFGNFRKQDIILLYEEKKNNKEFEISEYKTKLCLDERDRNLELKLSSKDTDTRIEALTNAIEGYYTDDISNVSDNILSNREGFLYIIKADEYVKIGIADDIKNRLKQIQGTCPIKLEIINFWKIRNYTYFENLLHKHYKQYRVHGEWFQLPREEVNLLFKIRNIEEAIRNKSDNLLELT